MAMRTSVSAAIGLFCGALLTAFAAPDGSVDFSSERWSVASGQVVEFLGRPAFMGTATLKDVEFENGVIEFDVAVATDRARSYPGVTFRAWPDGSWERFYIRPHRSALYADVLQYLAAHHGVDSWQLYGGPEATAPAVIPVNEWIHVKLEVSGSQARVFLGQAAAPALVVHRLRHGPRTGSVGVMGPADGTAFFSRFSCRADDHLAFDPPPPVDTTPGIVRDWMISQPFPAARVDLETVPEAQNLGDLKWQALASEPSGLVDISRLHPRSGEPDVVFARTVLTAAGDEVRKLDFGYSDVVTIFANGRPLFVGDSRYQGRDSSFLGIAGWFDSVYVPLREGDNELTLAVAESSGGWGFMVRDGRAVFAAGGLAPAWETSREFLVPESAAFDPARNCLYVSNYDPFHPSGPAGGQAVARLGLDGRIEAPRWVEGLAHPTGLAVAGEKLYAVERQSIAEIDIPRARVAARYPIPAAGLPNDIAAAADGALYVSDSQRATIFRYAAGQVAEWIRDPGIERPNGICIDGPQLIVGTNGDGSLKSIDLQTREIRTIARLGPGTIDGVEKAGPGVYLVSHNEGRLFRVSRDGAVLKLLDLTVVGRNIADFTYVESRDLLVIPTFADNRVVAYSMPDAAPAAGSAVTVPFILDHNRMIVAAEIQTPDGDWTAARLWVDTGNPDFLVSETFARDVGMDVGAASGGEKIPAPAGVRIGGLALDFSGVSSVVDGRNQWLFHTMHHDANLPATVLSRYHVVFDYPARQLTIAAPGVLKPRGVRCAAAVHPQTGIVQIDAEIDGEPRSFALDNGASFSFVSDELVAHWLGRHADWPRSRGAVGCANIWGWWPEEAQWPLVRVPEIRWGTWTIADAALVGLPAFFPGQSDVARWYSRKTARPVDGFLGPNAFKDCRVEIVYAESAVYFERGAPPDAHDLDIVGLTVRPLNDGRYEVAGVVDADGKPAVPGVEPGDILLQAGEVATTGATMGTVVDALRGRPGERRRLKLERNGETFTVEAEVKRFL